MDFETEHDSQNHRIIFIVRDLLTSFKLTPLLKQIRLKRAFSNLEDHQGGRSHSFSEQPGPVLDHCHHKNNPLYLIRVCLQPDVSVAQSVSLEH